jgi:hypothetical protein
MKQKLSFFVAKNLPDVVEFVTETGEFADDDHDRMSRQCRTGRTSRQNSGWPYKISRQGGQTWKENNNSYFYRRHSG